jgi:hypothetical protein
MTKDGHPLCHVCRVAVLREKKESGPILSVWD